MAVRILSLLILLLGSSCQVEQNGTKQLESYLLSHLISVEKMEATYAKAFYPEKSIVKPQMTWKNIIRAENKTEAYCLFYRVPHKRLSQGRGILKIIRASRAEDCSRVLEKKADMMIDGLSHLKMYFTSKRERNLKLKTEYKPFHLYLSAAKEGEGDWAFVMPLYNVSSKNLINPNKLNRKKKVFKRYDRPWQDTLAPGMKIYDGDFKPKRKAIIDGDLLLNYAQNNYKFCYRVDRTCKVTQDFSCGSCKRGWYSVVDNACPRGGSKLCGVSRCGKRGQPACPRGESFEDTEDGSFCFKGSKAGICEKGLSTYCDENKILVCR